MAIIIKGEIQTPKTGKQYCIVSQVHLFVAFSLVLVVIFMPLALTLVLAISFLLLHVIIIASLLLVDIDQLKSENRSHSTYW